MSNKKKTNQQRIIDFIYESGEHGRTLREIQEFIAEMVDYPYSRGLYSGYLYGPRGIKSERPGIFYRFNIQKNSAGRRVCPEFHKKKSLLEIYNEEQNKWNEQYEPTSIEDGTSREELLFAINNMTI